MTENLRKAKQKLEDGASLVIVSDMWTAESKRTGVAPLLELSGSPRVTAGGSAADKVVGRAAALLMLRAGIAGVYAGVICTPALELLREKGLEVFFGAETPAIRNRADTDLCPFEKAVAGLTDPEEGYAVIKRTFETLTNKKIFTKKQGEDTI